MEIIEEWGRYDNGTPRCTERKILSSLIKDYLINDNGYINPSIATMTSFAIDVDCLFFESTQKVMNKLKEIYKELSRQILNNLDKQLRTRGSINVLKHGIKDYGVKLDIVFFKPPTDLNPDQSILHQKNILSVTEELNYLDDKRIDLVIFLNGIPIITMELKNAFTGQTYKQAIKQYKMIAAIRSNYSDLKKEASSILPWILMKPI